MQILKGENMSEFNFKSSVCTSREQSERLLALGLKKETADCVLPKKDNLPPLVITYDKASIYATIEIIPAWSLHRLIEMIKKSDYLHYNDMGCIKLYIEQDDFDRVIAIISIMVKEGYFNKEYLV